MVHIVVVRLKLEGKIFQSIWNNYPIFLLCSVQDFNAFLIEID